jgi:hypothetical protein
MIDAENVGRGPTTCPDHARRKGDGTIVNLGVRRSPGAGASGRAGPPSRRSTVSRRLGWPETRRGPGPGSWSSSRARGAEPPRSWVTGGGSAALRKSPCARKPRNVGGAEEDRHGRSARAASRQTAPGVKREAFRRTGSTGPTALCRPTPSLLKPLADLPTYPFAWTVTKLHRPGGCTRGAPRGLRRGEPGPRDRPLAIAGAAFLAARRLESQGVDAHGLPNAGGRPYHQHPELVTRGRSDGPDPSHPGWEDDPKQSRTAGKRPGLPRIRQDPDRRTALADVPAPEGPTAETRRADHRAPRIAVPVSSRSSPHAVVTFKEGNGYGP